jgi:hypothetical protein
MSFSIQSVTSIAISGTLSIPGSAALGVWDITITNPDGQYVIAPGAFTVTTAPPPTFTSVAPTLGARGTTVSITITGNNFMNGVYVDFENINNPRSIILSVQSVTGTTITGTVSIPAYVVLGAWDIHISNPDGQYVIARRVFTVIEGYLVKSITPSSGKVGKTVDITNLAGTGWFLQGAIVLLTGHENDIYCSNVIVVSPTRITCTFSIPIFETPGMYNVVVANPDGKGASLVNGFTVIGPKLKVSAITPATGAPGTSVITNIAGDGFKQGAAVKLIMSGTADIPGTGVVVVSMNKITCTFNIPVNAVTGEYRVVVINPDAQSNEKVWFTVKYPAPTVSMVVPDTVAQSQFTAPVVVKGTGFRNGAIVTFVDPTGFELQRTCGEVRSTWIPCLLLNLPFAHTGHDYTVIVTNSDGQSGRLKKALHVTIL